MPLYLTVLLSTQSFCLGQDDLVAWAWLFCSFCSLWRWLRAQLSFGWLLTSDRSVFVTLLTDSSSYFGWLRFPQSVCWLWLPCFHCSLSSPHSLCWHLLNPVELLLKLWLQKQISVRFQRSVMLLWINFCYKMCKLCKWGAAWGLWEVAEVSYIVTIFAWPRPVCEEYEEYIDSSIIHFGTWTKWNSIRISLKVFLESE